MQQNETCSACFVRHTRAKLDFICFAQHFETLCDGGDVLALREVWRPVQESCMNASSLEVRASAWAVCSLFLVRETQRMNGSKSGLYETFSLEVRVCAGAVCSLCWSCHMLIVSCDCVSKHPENVLAESLTSNHERQSEEHIHG